MSVDAFWFTLTDTLKNNIMSNSNTLGILGVADPLLMEILRAHNSIKLQWCGESNLVTTRLKSHGTVKISVATVCHLLEEFTFQQEKSKILNTRKLDY